MKIYYDTEFTSLDGLADRDMISAGFVAEDGREWYIEITDFLREDCSPFVVDTVLPLLGKGDRIPERLAGMHFAWRLGNWLESFGQPITLISDSSCDWHLLNSYCYSEFSTLPFKIRMEVWKHSENLDIQRVVNDVEAAFWAAHPGMMHHALYDTRRLKRIADVQRQMQARSSAG